MNERELFIAALQIEDPAAQSAYLGQACGGDADLRQRVDILLHALGQAGSFLQQPAADAAATSDAPPPVLSHNSAPAEGPGTVIGPYKLLQQIGEGGMGTVFMAEQTQPVQRKVALKVIKPGMDSRQVIARFEAERQALAMMDHVNIARVFDGGATEAGRPYFVMELVHGVPITRYCDDNHLSPRERLELFVPVCQAIQHAHQKGIIHRDIKPSNVMITLYDGKPVPKVIDFGVAKATEHKLTERTLFTQYGTMVGTLEYMSPEQAAMSALGVDTRSDIYSLGVLLYELLTGSTPLSHKRLKEAAYADVLRMIKEEEPPKPSTRLSDSGEALATISAQRHMEPAKLTKLVRGELDWIVMKTLEKDRNRRYETANGFAADVQRYLNDEPVLACPPSASYRLRKFARRNKGPVMAASLVALALVVAIIGTTWGMIRATDAEASAVHEAKQKELALNDKTKALAAAETSEQNAKNKEALAKEAQKEAVESLLLAKEAQKEAVENLKDALAAVDQMLTRVAVDRLEHVPQMEPIRRDLLQDALKFYQKFLQSKSDDPVIRRETALAYWRVGSMHHSLGQSAEAEVEYSHAIAMLKKLEAESPLDPHMRSHLINIHVSFSWVLGHLGKREGIEESLRRAVQIAEDLVKDFPEVPRYPILLANAGNQLVGQIAQTRPEEAKKILTRNLTLTNEPSIVTATYLGLGYLSAAQGRKAEAEEYYREALKHIEKHASQYPATVVIQQSWAGALQTLARSVASSGRPQEAEELQRRAIGILDKSATNHPAIPSYRSSLAAAHLEHAGLLKKLNRLEEAEKSYRRALDVYDKLAKDFGTLPAYQQMAFDQRLSLGQFLMDVGRAQEAQQVYGEAIALPETLAVDVPAKLKYWQGLVRTHMELGRLLTAVAKTPEAEAAYGQVIAIQEKLEASLGGKPEFRRELIESHLQAANLLKAAGQMQGAEKLHRLASAHYALLEKAFRDALANDQVLARDNPTERKYHTQLARAQTGLAFFYRDRGGASRGSHDWVAAQDHYAKYLKLSEDAAKAAPIPQGEGNLAWAYRDLGDLYLEWEKPAAARQHYLKMLEVAKALEVANPKNAQAQKLGQTLVGRAYGYLGRVSLELGDSAAQEYFRKAGNNCKLAWSLATCPDPKARDAGQAIELAKKVSELAPKDGDAWKVLGAAQYRAGNWNAAIEALENANQLKAGGDGYEWFYLAMAHWQRGEKEQARKWYDQAIQWIEKENPRPGFVFGDNGGEQLRRLRTEVTAVLGLKDQPTPPGEKDRPKM